MDIQKATSSFMVMGKNGIRNERWFLIERKFTKDELVEMVDNGWLIKKEKDPNDFMSDVCYILTQDGFELAWGKDA